LNPSLREQLELLLTEDIGSVLDRERRTLPQILESSCGRVVLFGAGSLGRSALTCVLRDGIQPVAFADNNPARWGTDISGVPVLSPADAARLYGDSAVFFVTIWSLGHRYAETHAQLTGAGCAHVYPAAPLRWKYADELLPHFLQERPRGVYEDAADVLAAFDLWADERSREEYLAQIRYRALGDAGSLPAPDSEASYFLDSLYSLSPDEVFIDCGAYDGDTLRDLLARAAGNFSRFVAIEPDPANHRAVRRYVASLAPEVAARISVYPYAVSSQRARMRFSASGDESAAISQDGDVVVEAVPLDELAGDLHPTFLKMDIEGAEVDALVGARELIAQHRPILSICLYHRQSDLWRIPLLIHSIFPHYRHYLRSHEPDGWQTVGYAVPAERLHAPREKALGAS
jgi:FkbM family methyltransferase